MLQVCASISSPDVNYAALRVGFARRFVARGVSNISLARADTSAISLQRAERRTPRK